MHRSVQPELLDSLPADDPRAMRSRRDLARINRIMRQAALIGSKLRALAPPEYLVDLGGGDGRLLLEVARRSYWHGVKAVIADRQKILGGRTRHGFEKLGWHCTVRQGDVFDILENLEPGAVVTANLFLHHFQDDDLKRLLSLVAARACAFVACEPRRSTVALLGARLVGLIGANDVTRHDAVASVRAGFSGHELSALWPQHGWSCEEGGAFPFSHCFVAVRA